jgi:hypothetical protein
MLYNSPFGKLSGFLTNIPPAFFLLIKSTKRDVWEK